MTTHVFVYGTLKRGYWNGERLLEGKGTFKGTFKTLHEFDMTGSTIPFVSRNGDFAILGEVWEVDDKVLATLDQLEGHPRFYVRTPIEVPNFGTAEIYLCDHGPRQADPRNIKVRPGRVKEYV